MPKRVAVGAIEIEYDELGAGGRPFVIVHGFAGSTDDFADVAESFGALGRTLLPNLRGHGGTTNPGEGYTLDQLVADLAGFLDATGVERFDLLGHSLGGMIALRFTLSQPERVASLVLMDTAARSQAAAPRWLLWLICKIARHTPRRWLWRLIRANRKRFPAPTRRAEEEMGSERWWRRQWAKLEAMDPAAFDELFRSLVYQQPVTERLGEIRCPTLVLVGDQDTQFLNPSRELADGIRDARLIVVKDAHHQPQFEAREAWLEAVHAHLSGARAQRGASDAAH